MLFNFVAGMNFAGSIKVAVAVIAAGDIPTLAVQIFPAGVSRIGGKTGAFHIVVALGSVAGTFDVAGFVRDVKGGASTPLIGVFAVAAAVVVAAGGVAGIAATVTTIVARPIGCGGLGRYAAGFRRTVAVGVSAIFARFGFAFDETAVFAFGCPPRMGGRKFGFVVVITVGCIAAGNGITAGGRVFIAFFV